MIEISKLHKKFKTDFWKKPVHALRGVDLQIETGEIVGVVGPNGAGKTTLIKSILGLVAPSSGSINLFGKGYINQEAKSKIGYLPENAYYYDYLNPDEILKFYASLFGIKGKKRSERVSELLDLVRLSHRKDSKIRQFSKGMVQRVGIAQALINDPELIIFDEPMSGLDPIGRKDVRDIIMALKSQGKTMLIASHVLSDVEAVCDHVTIISDGKVSASGKLDELLDGHIDRVDVVFSGKCSSEQITKSFASKAQIFENQFMVSLEEMSGLEEVLEKGRQLGLSLISVTPHKKSLEDLFVEKIK